MEYLAILIIIFLIALFLERRLSPRLYRNRRERLVLTGIFFLIGVIWDTYAVWRGHWLFPPNKTVGLALGLLPVEEYLFFLIVPYFILTVYRSVDNRFQSRLTKLLNRFLFRS